MLHYRIFIVILALFYYGKSTLISATENYQIIKNGTFSGALTHWELDSKSNSRLILTNSADGSQDVATITLDASSIPVRLFQSGIPLHKGHDYRLTLDLKTMQVKRVSLDLRHDGIDGKAIGLKNHHLPVESDNSWHSHEILFTAGKDTCKGWLILNVANDTHGQLHIDNVQLEKVDNPEKQDSGSCHEDDPTPVKDMAQAHPDTPQQATPAEQPSDEEALAMSLIPRCDVIGNSLQEAREIYEEQCDPLRIDCDPMGNGQWKCASYMIGKSAPKDRIALLKERITLIREKIRSRVDMVRSRIRSRTPQTKHGSEQRKDESAPTLTTQNESTPEEITQPEDTPVTAANVPDHPTPADDPLPVDDPAPSSHANCEQNEYCIHVHSGQSIASIANGAPMHAKIIVNSGRYHGRVSINRNDITLVANGTVDVVGGFDISADRVTLSGFRIIGTNGQSVPGIRYHGAYGIIENNFVTGGCMNGIDLAAPWTDRNNGRTNNVTVRNNKVTQSVMVGIQVQGHHHNIHNNEVWDIRTRLDGCSSRGDADGFRFFGTGHRFTGNYIHDIRFISGTPHIDCFQTWGPAQDMHFERNRCILNAGHQGSAQGTMSKAFMLQSKPSANNGTNSDVRNLTIVNNELKAYRPVHVEDVVNGVIDNNIIETLPEYRNHFDWPWSLFVDNEARNIRFTNNRIVNPTTSPWYEFSSNAGSVHMQGNNVQ